MILAERSQNLQLLFFNIPHIKFLEVYRNHSFCSSICLFICLINTTDTTITVETLHSSSIRSENVHEGILNRTSSREIISTCSWGVCRWGAWMLGYWLTVLVYISWSLIHFSFKHIDQTHWNFDSIVYCLKSFFPFKWFLGLTMYRFTK